MVNNNFITIKLLDFVYRPDFYKQKTQRFGNWICFRLQANGIACGKASFWFFCRVGAPPRLKKETDPVSETLCFLFVEIRTMDKVQKLNSNECYTPSSEPVRIITSRWEETIFP
jgi:hypothetical protein